MAKKAKFYKTLIVLEILSEDMIPDDITIGDIIRECHDGAYSGVTISTDVKFLNGKQMANALLKQGSDPSFFNLTKDGKKN